jgi:hypothetical protein
LLFSVLSIGTSFTTVFSDLFKVNEEFTDLVEGKRGGERGAGERGGGMGASGGEERGSGEGEDAGRCCTWKKLEVTVSLHLEGAGDYMRM